MGLRFGVRMHGKKRLNVIEMKGLRIHGVKLMDRTSGMRESAEK